MAEIELMAEGALIYQREEDGGWTRVASANTGTPDDAELAALLARAPELKRQRDMLLEACRAAYGVISDDDKCSDESFFLYDEAVDMVRAAIADVEGETP